MAQGKRGGEVRSWGTITNRPDQVRRLAEKLASDGCRLHFCYEAGLCGDGLHRQVSELGHDCVVVRRTVGAKGGNRAVDEPRVTGDVHLRNERRMTSSRHPEMHMGRVPGMGHRPQHAEGVGAFTFFRGRHRFIGVDTLALDSIAGARIFELLAPKFEQGLLKPFAVNAAAVHPFGNVAAAHAAVLRASSYRVILKP